MGPLLLKRAAVFLKDVGLSGISSVLSTFALQLVAFPAVNAVYGPERLAQELLAYGFASLVSLTVQTAISNAYIRNYHADQPERNLRIFHQGYRPLAMVPVACIIVVSAGARGIPLSMAVAWSLFGLALASRGYVTAWFRTRLDYNSILLINATVAAGYCGSGFLLRAGVWSVPVAVSLLAAELMGLLFPLVYRRVLPLQGAGPGKAPAPLRREYRKEMLSFFAVSGMAQLGRYMDRIVTSILLTGNEAAVFLVGMSFSRLATQPLATISGVLYSYLAQRRSWSARMGRLLLIASLAGGFLVFATGLTVGKHLLEAVYPDLAASALPVFWVSLIGLSLSVADTLGRPVLFRWAPLSTKIWIDAVAVTLSALAVAALFVTRYDLRGVAMALALQHVVRGGATLAASLRMGRKSAFPEQTTSLP